MEKKEMSLPTVIYPEVVQPSSTSKENKTSVKKIAVISVATLIGLALILGSVLLAVHLVGNKDDSYYAKEKTISPKDDKGNTVEEKVYVNTKTNEEAFETSKISVVHDFNKGLTVIKTLDNKGKYVCYLTTLNSTGMPNPADMEKALSSDEENDKGEAKKQKHDQKYQQTAVEVDNRGFLSPKSKEMCQGYPIYWMIPSGENADESHRQKRGICVGYDCYHFYYYGYLYEFCYYYYYYC